MFGSKEHIVVAVSGGKDSLSLLHFLINLSKKVPTWKITALLIDEGIKGYREFTIKDFLSFVNEYKVNYRVISFKEEFGYTLDDMVKLGKEKGLPYLPCSYCGVMRRYLLNKYARMMGGTVLATAHNLDDVVQTFIMNIIRNSWDKILRLSPATLGGQHPKFVRKVKPFFEVLEKETALYAILNGIYPKHFVECPYAQTNIRWLIRKQLNQLEEKQPGIKYGLLRSLLTVLDMLKHRGSHDVKLRSCKICGEPTPHEVCRACMYRIELGILKVSPTT